MIETRSIVITITVAIFAAIGTSLYFYADYLKTQTFNPSQNTVFESAQTQELVPAASPILIAAAGTVTPPPNSSVSPSILPSPSIEAATSGSITNEAIQDQPQNQLPLVSTTNQNTIVKNVSPSAATGVNSLASILTLTTLSGLFLVSFFPIVLSRQ